MQIITIAGNVGKDAATKTVGTQTVTEWSVGVSAGRDKETTWYKCSMWGQRGERVAAYITKGGKVTVVGTLTAGVYDGKPDMKINVQDVSLPPAGQRAGSGSRDGHPLPDDGDSVPF
jgi:single-strand DNA-binding protein